MRGSAVNGTTARRMPVRCCRSASGISDTATVCACPDSVKKITGSLLLATALADAVAARARAGSP